MTIFEDDLARRLDLAGDELAEAARDALQRIVLLTPVSCDDGELAPILEDVAVSCDVTRRRLMRALARWDRVRRPS